MTELALEKASNCTLRDGEQTQLARLIYLALPDFYGALPGGDDDRLGLIAAETVTQGTECENPWIAREGAEILGAICAFPLSELKERQQQSMLGIMRGIDRAARKEFRDTMRDGGHSVQPFDQLSGLYIARISVAATRQGSGLGQRLFAALVAKTGEGPISLHVDRENAAAIRFYEKLGFEFLPALGNFRKRAMRRA